MNEKSINKAIGWGLILGAAASAIVLAGAGLVEARGIVEVALAGADVHDQLRSAASCFGLAALCCMLAIPGWLILTDARM